jgi:hypothetical protein
MKNFDALHGRASAYVPTDPDLDAESIIKKMGLPPEEEARYLYRLNNPPAPGPAPKHFDQLDGKLSVRIIEIKAKPLAVVNHIYLAWPLRCWAQLATAVDLAWLHRAVLHITEGCAQHLTRSGDRRVNSGCGHYGCQHSPAELREEGLIAITPDTRCRLGTDPSCLICKGRWRDDGTMALPKYLEA